MPTEPPAGDDLDIATALASVPLFAALTPGDLASVASAAQLRSFKRAEVLFHEGEPSLSCFVVVSGEVDVTTGTGDDRALQVRRLGPGELFGEIGVLLGRARTASVRATRAATAIEIPAEHVRHAITANPLALEQVSNLLASRLVSTTRGDRTSDTPRVLVVTGEPRVPGRSLVAATVASLLHAVTGRDTVWVELASQPRGRGGDDAVALDAIADGSIAPGSAFGPDRWAGGTRHLRVHTPNDARSSTVLARAIERLRGTFTFVVVDIDDAHAQLIPNSAELGDAVVHVSHRLALAPPPAGTRRLLVLNLHDARAQPIAINHNEPFVLRTESAVAHHGAAKAAEILLDAPGSPATRALRRLVHHLLGTTLGVALGGGAAFGLAHVGVLEVLDRNDLPVDLVVGTSMGSIVATGYAAGITTPEMHDVAERLGRSVRTFVGLVDLNPTTSGLLSGRRLQRTFNPLLGAAETFDDLVVPCRTVAADIESGQRVCIGTGRLEDAFRASSSIPMLIAPWVHDGKVLVDGAMVDPVPAEVAREMGADLVIAVNVVPHLRKGVTTVISRVTRGVSRLNPLTLANRNRGMPNIVDTAMNTIQTLQHELGHFKAASADVRINPDLADFTWIEFYRAPEIIERGQQAAENALPAVRRVLAERLAAALPG